MKINNKNIKNITDIQGIDKLSYLKRLNLSHNDIKNLQGIENLVNLKILKLSNNKIQEIDNLQNLLKLERLYLDNNQLKELKYGGILPDNLKYLNIAKNPIEKFQIYTKQAYKKIHFGPKKWFPKQEIKRLRKQVRPISSYKSYRSNEGFNTFLIIFVIWVVLSFLLALIINLAFWGVMQTNSLLNIGYWECLFNQGLWTFAVGCIGAIIVMVIFYIMLED